jgi:hypothetical protein
MSDFLLNYARGVFMKFLVRLAVVALVLFFCLLNGPFARADEPQAANVSRAAISVFGQVCWAKINNQAEMDAWLSAHQFREVAPQAAAKLSMGAPGRVWLNGEAGAPFAVITRPEGILCQVMAPTVDQQLVTQSFRDTISALARPGRLEVRKDEDGEVTLGGQPGHRVAFRVGAPPIDAGGYIFVLSAAPPRPGAVALLITASRAAPAHAP